MKIWMLGYGRNEPGRFRELLIGHSIELLVDIRRFPISRTAGFNVYELPQTISPVEYVHMPDLGGFLKPSEDSPNYELDANVRGFADHLRTKSGKEAVAKLMVLAKSHRTAVMCMEWMSSGFDSYKKRCHRLVLADLLEHCGWCVYHIVSGEDVVRHRKDDRSFIDDGGIIYQGQRLFS